MKSFVILFRAINVGGRNKLPMKELVPLLESSGFEQVSYYIQSGNIVLSSAEDPTEKIQAVVSGNFGFTPELFVLTESDIQKSCKNNPYKQFEGKSVHFYFCHNHIELDQVKIDKYVADSEQYAVVDKVFYLYAPDGIGRSKLVSNIASCLGQQGTGRNLNTMNKISLMLDNS